jgi:hypothetical protein
MKLPSAGAGGGGRGGIRRRSSGIDVRSVFQFLRALGYGGEGFSPAPNIRSSGYGNTNVPGIEATSFGVTDVSVSVTFV